MGYMLFFAHRYRIAKRRHDVIEELELLERIKSCNALSPEIKKGLRYVLWSVSASKERLNYMIISTFSIIAITIALLLDFGIVPS